MKEPNIQHRSEDEVSQRAENFTMWLRRVASRVLERIASLLIRAKISANLLSVVGLAVVSVAGYLVSGGHRFWAGVTYLIGSLFDALDGAVARQGGSESRFGALLDSTLDRYGEAFLLIGLTYDYASHQRPILAVVTVTALFGSMMVSYTRARSEGLSIDNRVGLLTRVERLIIVIFALLAGWIDIGIWVLAFLTQFTVVQRLWNVYTKDQSKGG